MGSEFHRARLLFDTVRHLRPVQVWGRILAPLRAETARIALRKLAPENVPERGRSVLRESRTPFHDPWNTRERLVSGSFTFLNRTAHLGWPPHWAVEHPDLLWRFYLHYHQYLHLLEESERRALCQDWIEANPVGGEVAWHPYVVSRRIVSWCRSLPRNNQVYLSLWNQAEYLYRTVEWHQPGNHLLENGRALLLAACVLEHERRAQVWARRGAEILVSGLEDQLMADGVHIERSPMYHALVLEGLLDVRLALRKMHVSWIPDVIPLRELLCTAVESMLDYLLAVTHPDGCLALLNDSTVEIAPPTARLVEYAGVRPSSLIQSDGAFRFPNAGQFGFRDGSVFLLVDGGAIGPDHLPAHAHADIFTYELDVDDLRLVVDSGVYEYAGGAMRDYVRSTRAHNTVSVDGLSQAECWKSFRVGRRSPPRDVRFRSSDAACIFEGRFDGYGVLIGERILHHRKLVLDRRAAALRVEDTVTGQGDHRVESFIHLHPEAEVREAGGKLEVKRDGLSLPVLVEGGSAIVRSGWYCPMFGVRRENRVICITHTGPLPARLAYTIHYRRP